MKVEYRGTQMEKNNWKIIKIRLKIACIKSSYILYFKRRAAVHTSEERCKWVSLINYLICICRI